MADVKTCLTCNSTMTQGRIMKYNERAARTTIENDPAVMGGVIRVTLYPYKVALLRK